MLMTHWPSAAPQALHFHTNMIAEQSIPVYTTLSDVFGSLTASLEHASRWNNLAEEFEKRFGRKPTYIARAPGRIKYVDFPNASQIILFISSQLDWWVYIPNFTTVGGLMLYIYTLGEHIDYALFGVLPMAIERDILIACAPRPVGSAHQQTAAVSGPGSVVTENLHPKYTRQSFTPAPTQFEDASDRDVLIEGWHLDINTKELRWESYVKAGYYVRMLPFEIFN